MSKFRDVSDKIAFVTGAARGLGRGIAETLAEEGINIVIQDVSEDVKKTFEEIKSKNLNNRGYAIVYDVADEEAAKKAIKEVIAKFDRIDILVNNAGMHMDTGNLWETETAKLDRILSVNFKGQFYHCKYAAPQMIKQKGGCIVNIGSFFGKVGHAGSASYGASKGAVHTMTQSLALELAPYNVTVNALCPGLAATEMHWGFMTIESQERGITFDQLKEEELSTIPLHRYGYGKDYAGAIMWLASESGSYVTGQLININGGLDFT
ncbi:MAG: SDR family oxidoreductase [Actinobacteria bacterium]|nr:SDR family oxidoreductase [Actinomycetota bacterium]MBM3712328.1 SDR family oxidoreductase [Actinomycetota bacterium]